MLIVTEVDGAVSFTSSCKKPFVPHFMLVALKSSVHSLTGESHIMYKELMGKPESIVIVSPA